MRGVDQASSSLVIFVFAPVFTTMLIIGLINPFFRSVILLSDLKLPSAYNFNAKRKVTSQKVCGKEKKEVIEKIKDILIREYYITFCYVHGSFLDKDRFNDIDLALYIDEDIIKETECLDSEISLSLKLEREFNKSIDIRFLNFSPLPFRYHASTGLLLFCKDDTKKEGFLCKTWAEYFDFLPISKSYLREMLDVEV